MFCGLMDWLSAEELQGFFEPEVTERTESAVGKSSLFSPLPPIPSSKGFISEDQRLLAVCFRLEP